MEDAGRHLLTIFSAALERGSAGERDAYLDDACGEDAALRDRVEALLRAHEHAGGFLGTRPEACPVWAADTQPGEAPPERDPDASARSVGADIGPYKLIEQIGEGGMGTVYLAEQSRPVRRAVALKVVRAGVEGRHVLARFEAERQALALMDHPNIARVLDADATERGLPYFVMELVKGVPITRFCDERRLSPRERLELFIPVCQAVQHAHQKGVIHRDLKPSNVLVALYDGAPVPKVIDFGVAKATGAQRLTEATLHTGFGTLVGTPEYMSPEQAELNQLDVDTRTDIYSLGVLLYELLTATTPLQRRRVREATVLEVLRLIREQEPTRPSHRLSSTEELPSIAANRGVEPRRLAGLVRGDLDWIVMKALEKDRDRRYETANGLAADLRRHLDGEPVQACPPSAWYGLRKWVGRNMGLVLGGSLIVLALVLGILGTSIGLWYADCRRREAEEQTALANAVKDFLKRDVLQLADPATQPSGAGLDYHADMKLRDVVVGAAGRIEGRFDGQPLVEAEIRHTLGVTLLNMGRADLAIGQLERVCRLRDDHLGPDHPDTLAAMTDLAGSYADAGRHAEALRLREDVLARRRRALGPDHPDTLTSMSNLTISYRVLGRHAEALRLREDVLARRRRALGPDHPDTLLGVTNLANSYSRLGREAEALELREETLARRIRKLGPDHPDTLWNMTDLANSYADAGRHAGALQLRQETLARRERTLGPDHIHTLSSISDIANSYSDAGRHAEALRLREDVLARRRRALGPDHPDTLRSAEAVIHSLLDLDRPAEALPRIDELLGTAAEATQSGRYVDPGLIPKLLESRMGIHREAQDAIGCRATARMWDRRDPRDAGGMYDAARFWAITAAVQADGPAPESARLADEDAIRAMAWLRRALAAGLADRTRWNHDTDLDFLRGREDFQRLAIGAGPRCRVACGEDSNPDSPVNE